MDKFLLFLEGFRDDAPALCDGVARLWKAIMEASATDVNPVQNIPSPGTCTQGIIPNQTGKSGDPFIQSLIDRSYFGRFGQSQGVTTPGRTTLGIMGGGNDRPSNVSATETGA